MEDIKCIFCWLIQDSGDSAFCPRSLIVPNKITFASSPCFHIIIYFTNKHFLCIEHCYTDKEKVIKLIPCQTLELNEFQRIALFGFYLVYFLILHMFIILTGKLAFTVTLQILAGG